MKKMLQTFFRRVWTSLTRPSRYAEFLRQPTSAGVKYLYGLLATTLFVTMVVLFIGFLFSLPLIQRGLAALDRDLPTLYPRELVITLKDGEIETNVQEPYFIDLPQHWQDFLRSQAPLKIQGREVSEPPQHFITFDSAAGVEDYAMEESLILVTRKFIVFPDKDVSYRVISVSRAEQDFTMNRAVYDQVVTAVLRFLRYVPAILAFAVGAGLLLFPFVGAVFTLLGYLLWLLFAVLIVWALAAVMNKNIGYGRLYRLSLHGLTLPILATFVLGWLGVTFPFLFSLIFLGWMIAVLRYLPKKIASRR